MSRLEVLNILKNSEGFISGESISGTMGISRAAVWKTVKLLRQEGYVIRSKTNCGYMLEAIPEVLDAEKMKMAAANDLIELHFTKSVDSTNNAVKKLAQEGAKEGTVLVSDHQTAGRGRYGRSFVSPKGKGIYMSILLRPESVEDIAGITCMTAVAVCKAIEKVSKVKPEIKWTNDVLAGGKKICGILTEMSSEGESGEVRFVVIGIGVNVNHETSDFPSELRDIAGSLYLAGGKALDRNLLAGELAACVYNMYKDMKQKRSEYMNEYRKRCVTLGKMVEFTREEKVYRALAENVEEDGALIVRLDSGDKLSIRFGEISIISPKG